MYCSASSAIHCKAEREGTEGWTEVKESYEERIEGKCTNEGEIMGKKGINEKKTKWGCTREGK